MFESAWFSPRTGFAPSGVTSPSAAGGKSKKGRPTPHPPKKCSNGIGIASDIVTHASIG